jgi:hypothetical protein
LGTVPTELGRSTLERRHGNGQQERVPQGVNGLEHANVLDQRLIPQEAEEDSQNDNVNGEHDGVVQEFLLGAGLQEVQHLFIRYEEKSS